MELAYVISDRHRGQQYAHEAARLVLEGLDAASITSPVYATIRPDDIASRRVAEGLAISRRGAPVT